MTTGHLITTSCVLGASAVAVTVVPGNDMHLVHEGQMECPITTVVELVFCPPAYSAHDAKGGNGSTRQERKSVAGWAVLVSTLQMNCTERSGTVSARETLDSVWWHGLMRMLGHPCTCGARHSAVVSTQVKHPKAINSGAIVTNHTTAMARCMLLLVDAGILREHVPLPGPLEGAEWHIGCNYEGTSP